MAATVAAATAAATGRESLGRLIPHEILLWTILPWLSFKSLCMFKCVCKEWRRIISCDPGFALEQSRRPSYISSGVVYNGTDRLVFFSTYGSPIGVPRPSLYHSESRLQIAASTNGLLCYYYDSPRSLYVCNPATGKKAAIKPQGMFRHHTSIGLAFDPSISPDRFKLVGCLLSSGCRSATTEYSFDVFSSDTGQWMSSSQVFIPVERVGRRFPGKAVFARGILYWDCVQVLVWLDPDSDAAGHTMMPPLEGSLHYMAQGIGVWEGRVTRARASDTGLEVWVMRECGGWERRHQLGWNRDYLADMLGTNEPMRGWRRRRKRRLRSISGEMAPFEGGDRVYMAVREQPGVKMLCFDLKTGKATCYDLDSEMHCFDGFYGYHNSMVDVPKPLALGGDGGGNNHAWSRIN